MANKKHRRRLSATLIIREMQIKTTRRYYFTSTRLAIIKKTDNNKNWQACGKTEILLYSCWGCKMVQLLWKTVDEFLKWLNRVTIWPSNSTGRYTPKGNENICLHKHLYKNVYSSVIYNCRDVETTQMSLNWWTD